MAEQSFQLNIDGQSVSVRLNISKALKALGVDVPDDPKFLKKLSEAAEDPWNR